MSSEPHPEPGRQGPDDDPFRKRQPPPESEQGADGGRAAEAGSGSPYDAPPSYAGGPYGGPPPGGAGPGDDPLAGMAPPADSGRRTLARIVDMVLVGIVVWLLSWAFHVTDYRLDSQGVAAARSFGQGLIAAVLYIAYDTILTARRGQTLGKRWLGLRVADLADGATPSTRTSLIRAAVLWIPFAFCCACLWTAFCGGWSFFDKPYKQGLHDKAAKTVVVSVR
ncbi:RDD family protein [Streptomyces sp. WMMC905]|uniref:RDD family protein n=1 Tax=Streptomyces sp. WMMC905 TaxID=3404123 RepID=UPI003B922E0B